MKNNITFALRVPLQAITVATIVALLAWTIGLPSWITTANAATVARFSDTMTDSDLGLPATHTIEYTLKSNVTGGQTMRLTFDPLTQRFDFGTLATTDVTISAISGGTLTQVAACGLGTDEVTVSTVDAVNDYVELTVCAGDTITANTVVGIVVVGGATKMVNPSIADTYIIRLGGTMADTGDTRIAIIDDVTVTAQVDTIFTFSINGVAGGVTVNDDLTATFASTTATTVPFGIIAPNEDKVLAQELRVDTNAYNGFSVTVFADQTLTAGNGATIDEYRDGVAIASTTTWNGPSALLADADTWGHWGLTSDDNVVSSSTGPNLWGAGEAAYTGDFINEPVEVFYYNGPVEYSKGTVGVGFTKVAYKVEISNLQEAAQDYRATLTYIATPVF